MTRLLTGLFLVWLAVSAPAAEVIPPAPKAFFNDNANVVPAPVASQLNETLAQFERDSSSQLLVAIYPRMQTDSSIEDYANRLFQAWGPGLKDKDNGAVLLVFIQDRKMRIEVGYGLEPRLTDAECFRIIEELKPHFRSGDYTTGLTNAVSSMIAATQGEYTGTGKTLAESKAGDPALGLALIAAFLFFVFAMIPFLIRLRQIQRGVVFGPTGRYTLPGDPAASWWNTSTSWGSGGSSSSSSWGDSGGSSFSGGGGSSGGGGASGDW
jgi:uncharacterized protein